MSNEEFHSNPNIHQDIIRKELEAFYAREALKNAAVETIFGDDLNVEKIHTIGELIESKRVNVLDQNLCRHNFGKAMGRYLSGTNFKQPHIAPDNLRECESIAGGSIFGEVVSGQTRKFYCESSNKWTYEDSYSNGESISLLYEVREDGVLKISNKPGDVNTFIRGKELDDFRRATEAYCQVVSEEIYSDHNLGKKAA